MLTKMLTSFYKEKQITPKIHWVTSFKYLSSFAIRFLLATHFIE